MKVGIVEKIALDAPDLVIHLVPFRARIDVHLEVFQFQFPIAWLRGGRGWRDEPLRTLLIKSLFAVGRHGKNIDAANKRFLFARGQVELGHGGRCWLIESWNIDDCADEKYARFAGVKARNIARFDWQGHYALADAIKVDGYLDGFLFFIVFLVVFLIAALFEDRIARIADAVGYLRFLAAFQ